MSNYLFVYLFEFPHFNNNNNNNNNRVYTPLSERCSQSRVFTTYQIQISEKNTCRHSHTDRVTNVHN